MTPPRRRSCCCAVGLAVLVHAAHSIDYDYDSFPTKSGVSMWVDVDTPASARKIRTSRGATWDLVMSDEFQIEGRSFRPGEDHLWTALDIPDGVNAALEMYNSSNVYTKNGKLINKVEEGPTVVTYYNQWLEVPGFETRTLHYKAGMMQSWNKFCMQGGLIEVSAKLPGAINNVPDAEHKSVTMNPNAVGEYEDPKTKVKRAVTPQDRIIDGAYYPTWPGIWLMGNLGRALFSASTTRMWPWSYDACDKDLPDLASNQLISACNATPGYGLNPNQGRGAPEIDVLEGGGAAISSSIQVAPGMPDNYRRKPVVKGGPDEEPWGLNKYCVYGKGCKTPGANMVDTPTSEFASRGHKSWYQGLKYAANNRCRPMDQDKQDYNQVYNFLRIGNLVIGSKTRNDGYIRWSLDGSPLFEIPAASLTSPPQRPAGSNASKNPVKVMVEEPMYVILNVALAKAWGATPPNIDIGPCRGNATHPPRHSWAYNQSNNICDSFPMYMEIDYIRVYQDKSSMAIGCDPPTHPTKEWIDGHLTWYTDDRNPMVPVAGRATCNKDDDCTMDNAMAPPTGRCSNRRCECVKGYGGPRCTKLMNFDVASKSSFGPSTIYPVLLLLVCIAGVAYMRVRRMRWLTRATVIAEATAASTFMPLASYKPAHEYDDDDDGPTTPVVAGIRRYYGPAHPTSVGVHAPSMA
ncbi:hypothetical protein H310_07904 [Aphanomyces invadans]|uniref:EGF-like domain-containing protein n=1 Tax=Aphanomyces invadans TaxID=157072 RepID=A0A024U0Y3_9STRA|nr:hypothetical protein H310_07904 [Aphanomyces invadans]ETV99869.1 hypothetical protein H310_07904 [Aphanomyces invadans]|eukprot:XP_008871645.1 hypothetical protein H310_07904 [Aphanomyces invadans]